MVVPAEHQGRVGVGGDRRLQPQAVLLFELERAHQGIGRDRWVVDGQDRKLVAARCEGLVKPAGLVAREVAAPGQVAVGPVVGRVQHHQLHPRGGVERVVRAHAAQAMVAEAAHDELLARVDLVALHVVVAKGRVVGHGQAAEDGAHGVDLLGDAVGVVEEVAGQHDEIDPLRVEIVDRGLQDRHARRVTVLAQGGEVQIRQVSKADWLGVRHMGPIPFACMRDTDRSEV
ncbi:hypothetical protein D3C86_1358060 [compost metagenome]